MSTPPLQIFETEYLRMEQVKFEKIAFKKFYLVYSWILYSFLTSILTSSKKIAFCRIVNTVLENITIWSFLWGHLFTQGNFESHIIHLEFFSIFISWIWFVDLSEFAIIFWMFKIFMSFNIKSFLSFGFNEDFKKIRSKIDFIMSKFKSLHTVSASSRLSSVIFAPSNNLKVQTASVQII